jgi:hypothetical protein
MATAAQAAANAANARLSTGPRTEQGKARSSQNARKHGLTARELVVLPADREEFETLRNDLLAEIVPIGVVEVLTFNQLLHAAWNLRRIRRLEADLAAGGADPLTDESSARTLDRLSLYAARAERAYYRAIRELRTLQTERASRAVTLTPQERALVPPLVSVRQATKRSQTHETSPAVKLALDPVAGRPMPPGLHGSASRQPHSAPPPPCSAVDRAGA